MKIITAILTIAFIAWVGYELLCVIASAGVMAKMSKEKKEQETKKSKDFGEDDQE